MMSNAKHLCINRHLHSSCVMQARHDIEVLKLVFHEKILKQTENLKVALVLPLGLNCINA